MSQFLIRIELKKNSAGKEPSYADYEALHKELTKMNVTRYCYSFRLSGFFHLPPATYGTMSDLGIAALHSKIDTVAQTVWRGPVGIVMAEAASRMRASGLEPFSGSLGVEPRYVIDVD